MLAIFGYGAQAILTGEGPWQNLKDHLANPVSANLVGEFFFLFEEKREKEMERENKNSRKISELPQTQT